MKVKELIAKLQEYDPETEVVIFNDIGKGVRKNYNVSSPHTLTKESVIHSLSGWPIAIDEDGSYPERYKRKECLLIN